jgi:hypothetical protein
MRSTSPNQPEEEEEFIQETPEAALIAAQVYLLTTQPKPDDLREQMHQAVIEEKLKRSIPEKRSREEVKCKFSRNETSESSEDEKRQKRKEDARNIIAQARVNNSC